MNIVKITRIQISKLFEEINYDIILKDNSPISIITAPNGRGKTTTLNFLNFVLDISYANFLPIKDIPFEFFRCYLSDGKKIELQKIQYDKPFEKALGKTKDSNTRENAAIYRPGFLFTSGDFKYVIYNKEKEKKSFLFSDLFNNAYHTDPSEYMSEEDEYYYPRARLTLGKLMVYISKEIKTYLEKIDCGKPVNFIKADRIQDVKRPQRNHRDYDEPVTESPLKIACEEISNYIKRETDKYNDAVSQAKDKLPEMFLNGDDDPLSYNEFMTGWKGYRNDLTRFQEIGLITPTEDYDIENYYNNPNRQLFLSTYLRAFKDTTAPLMDIYGRMRLFKDILDGRNSITGKKVKFSKDGVSLFVGNKKIELETLSSGEKHDFIMFYNLIFNTKSGGLVLIDEPEISLHIEWQVNYLDRLIEICNMNNLQAIIATHSPSIVSNHYDCVVDKGESYE